MFNRAGHFLSPLPFESQGRHVDLVLLFTFSNDVFSSEINFWSELTMHIIESGGWDHQCHAPDAQDSRGEENLHRKHMRVRFIHSSSDKVLEKCLSVFCYQRFPFDRLGPRRSSIIPDNEAKNGGENGQQCRCQADAEGNDWLKVSKYDWCRCFLELSRWKIFFDRFSMKIRRWFNVSTSVLDSPRFGPLGIDMRHTRQLYLNLNRTLSLDFASDECMIFRLTSGLATDKGKTPRIDDEQLDRILSGYFLSQTLIQQGGSPIVRDCTRRSANISDSENLIQSDTIFFS